MPYMPDGNLLLDIELQWTPLMVGGQNVPIWQLPLVRQGIDRPVIYRHVAEINGIFYTVYVGEGQSLNGPSGRPLVFQYSHGGHGRTRERIREFFDSFNGPHWTEVLTCNFLQIADERQRKALEGILNGYYYKQSLGLIVFQNGQLTYLNQ